MQNNDISGFPPLMDDVEALHAEIERTLRQAFLAFAAVILPSAGGLLYALGMVR